MTGNSRLQARKRRSILYTQGGRFIALARYLDAPQLLWRARATTLSCDTLAATQRQGKLRRGFMNRRSYLLFFTVILLVGGSCRKSPTGPQLPSQPVENTDRTQYYFSTADYKDTVWVEVENGTDSTIYRWYPHATVDLKQADGTWQVGGIIDETPLGPVLPHKTARRWMFIMNDDSVWSVGTYSFNAEVFFTDDQTCATKGCVSVSVRSNPFSLGWKEP